MSFISKIKKFFEESKQEKKEEALAISINELHGKIKEEEEKLEVNNKILNDNIKHLIYEFKSKIEHAIVLIEKTNLNERKEHERIKEIVQQNLILYISHLRRLLENLDKINEKNVENQLNSIFQRINEFNKISYASFEKATFLVGKPMAEARNAVKNFAERVRLIVEENKNLLEKNRTVENIKLNLGELENIRLNVQKSKDEALVLEDKLKNLKKEQDKVNKELDELKNSEELKSEREEIRKNLDELNNFEKEAYSIKQRIDFKVLARQYHSNKKLSQKLKDYNSDFIGSLKSEDDSETLNMFAIPELKVLQKKFLDFKALKSKKEGEIHDFEDKLKGIASNMSSIVIEINHEKEKQEKLEKKMQEINSGLKEKAKSISIVIN